LLRNFEPELWLNEVPDAEPEDINLAMSQLIHYDIENANAGVTPMSFLLEFREDRALVSELIPFMFKYIGFDSLSALPIDSVRPLMVGIAAKLLALKIKDVAIQPVIDDLLAARFVTSIIGTSTGNARSDVIIGDMENVGIDLTAVPLDEVIDFRKSHGSEYRAYAKEVRDFVLSLSLITENERLTSVAARRAEFDERVNRLRRIGRESFKRQSIGLGFGLAGAAWTLAHGDPWGAAFAAGAVAAGFSRPSLGSVGAAYTYVFRAARELSRLSSKESISGAALNMNAS
jgi:hypothetical protein